jgi:DUF1680 family protein
MGAALVGTSLPSRLLSSHRQPQSGRAREIPGAAARLKVPPRVELFPLSAVRLLEGPFKEHQELDRSYLHKLEPDRLLSWCRREARLDPKAPPYRGWESEGVTLPGAILGFYLSAATMMYQSTGDESLRKELEYIVGELAEVQHANGNGYLLPTVNGKKLFREIVNGRIEVGNDPYTLAFINGVFEPTYVLNKIMLGLYQAHQSAGIQQAREVLIGAADWFGQEVLDKLNEEQAQTLLDCEHGSLNESFADVYVLTGDEKYLAWARRLCHRVMLDPLSERQDILTRWHANTQIPKFTGFQRVHTLTGEQKLANAAEFFWKTVAENRSWVNGGNSADEHFNDPAKFHEAMLTLTGPETCNSVNMLQLTEALYRAHGAPSMIDFYERTLYNHILPAHDPERGMFVYYTSMRPGHYRVYSDEFDSMWCCVGTGMESPAKYGQMVYAYDAESLYVNLFIPAELHDARRGLTLRQETRFPNEPRTKLTIESKAPAQFTLKIRHPWWLAPGEMQVRVNGRKQDVATNAGTYAVLTREWKANDAVEIEFAMRLRVEALPNDPRYVALLYGPILLAGELGRDGLRKEDFWGLVGSTARHPLPEEDVPVFVGARDEIVKHIERAAADRLQFQTTGLAKPADVRLVPFYDLHFSRYSIYWRLVASSEWQEEAAQREELRRRTAALDERTIDRVLVGREESETAHAIKSQNSGIANGPAPGYRIARRVRDDGSLSYEMKAQPDVPLGLYCEYSALGDESPGFVILVNGRSIAAEEKLLPEHGERFRGATYEIPAELARGKSSVNVTFRGGTGGGAVALFDCRIVTRKS